MKKIGSIALDVVIVVAFVVSVFVIIANTSAQKAGGQPNIFGYVFSSVQTDSMEPEIMTGALVIGKMVDSDTQIGVGDIITFNHKVSGQVITKTHRVVKIDTENGIDVYTTRGDNNPDANNDGVPDDDAEKRTIDDVVAVHVTDIPAVGAIIDFLKSPVGFVICLVLPLLAFIGYQIYKLISLYLQNKKETMIQEAKDGVSEEAKDAIIREYLAKMQKENGENSDQPANNPEDNNGEQN